jgi:hypothetical protein
MEANAICPVELRQESLSVCLLVKEEQNGFMIISRILHNYDYFLVAHRKSWPPIFGYFKISTRKSNSQPTFDRPQNPEFWS